MSPILAPRNSSFGLIPPEGPAGQSSGLSFHICAMGGAGLVWGYRGRWRLGGGAPISQMDQAPMGDQCLNPDLPFPTSWSLGLRLPSLKR